MPARLDLPPPAGGLADLVTVRDLVLEDLGDLDWSGSAVHVAAVAGALAETYAGGSALLVLTLPNGRLVGLGGLRWDREPGIGWLEMLSIHETLHSLGLGTRLIRALEDRAGEQGARRVRLSVEHDNPRALRLYRRLGYRPYGSAVESWPVAGNRTYVTVCRLLERDLGTGSVSSAPDAR
jgi:ribosomal protein S18 acetylase RimI-like enzyme